MKNQQNKKVLVVIVSFNRKELLRKHIPSVLRTIYPNFDILVVDNGSSDGTVDFLKREYPDIKVLENEANFGFARANNTAFREYPDYDYYALLNNDMDVEDDWLDVMVDLAENDKKLGVVGPKIVYSEKRNGKYVINSAGGVVNRRDMSFDRFEGNADDGSHDRVEEVDFVSGGAMMIRGETLRDVRGFDDRMFFYYEDVDICLRLKVFGWKVMYCGKTRVYHDHMGTSRSWGSVRRTMRSGMNRVKSIGRRRGIVLAMVEMVRSPLEWLFFKVASKFTGVTYYDWLVGNARKEGLKF